MCIATHFLTLKLKILNGFSVFYVGLKHKVRVLKEKRGSREFFMGCSQSFQKLLHFVFKLLLLHLHLHLYSLYSFSPPFSIANVLDLLLFFLFLSPSSFLKNLKFMADNNSNKNGTRKTFKALSALCLTRPIDILYFIANISYYYSVDQTLTMKYLEELKIKDANTGLFCLQRIEEKILKEIGDEYKDREIEEVYRKSKEEHEKKMSVKEESKKEEKEIKKLEELNKEEESKKEEKHTEETSEEKNSVFNYLDHFPALIKPFLFVNDKVCVDFIAYLYKKKDLDYLDLLFEAHADKKDLMIELHLLKGRLLKSKIKSKNSSKLDVTEIQEALRRSSSKKEDENENVLPEKENISEEKENNSLSKKKDESSTPNVSEIESESEIKDITDNSVNISPSLLTYHINSAKLLLLNITKKDQKFFIDNAALFLTIQYDSDIFRELLLLSKLPYFFTCLYSTSTNIILPFYFYKYVYMNTCIYYDIPYNGYTLKYYLEYYKTLSTNVFPNDMGYVLVGKNMMMYYNETKALIKEDKVLCKKLKLIFREMVVFLLQVKFVREDEIHMKILENVEEYLEIFKDNFKDESKEIEKEDKEDDDKEENSNNPTLNHQMHINELTEKLKDEKFITQAVNDYENILIEKENDKENIKIITDTINNYSISHKTFLFDYLFDDLLINYITSIKYKHIFIEKIVKNKMITQLNDRVREEIVKSIKEKKDAQTEDAKYKVNKDKGNWRYRKYVEEHKKEIEEMVG